MFQLPDENWKVKKSFECIRNNNAEKYKQVKGDSSSDEIISELFCQINTV